MKSENGRRVSATTALKILAGGLALAVTASACTSSSTKSSQASSSNTSQAKTAPSVTITIAGPNQFNNDTNTFGNAWNSLVASFEQVNPSIHVNTEVLPLATFNQTESTELAAGTAPALVFDQATYKPYMVTNLDSYLNQPDPYVPGNKKWIDVFNPEYFGFNVVGAVNAQGHINVIPFNEVAVGLFYNKAAFAKAGITAPITTWTQFASDAAKLSAAGYTPLSMQSGSLGVGWILDTIWNMLAQKYFSAWNLYTPTGASGTSPQLTAEDITRAITTGALNTNLPAVAETLRLTKQMLSQWSTPNWSGVADTGGGSVVALQNFYDGKAAIAWGTDYAKGSLKGASFQYATMPFPTVTTATTSVSQNFPAEFGISGTGGTTYMIPSTTKGAQLAAAIKFLQFVTAPKYNQPWIEATGALPIVQGVAVPSSDAGLLAGSWGKPRTMGPFPGGAGANNNEVVTEGYLLGDKSMSSELSFLEGQWKSYAQLQISTNGWQNLSWAKG